MALHYIFQTGLLGRAIGSAELIFICRYRASPETINIMRQGGQIDGVPGALDMGNLEPGHRRFHYLADQTRNAGKNWKPPGRVTNGLTMEKLGWIGRHLPPIDPRQYQFLPGLARLPPLACRPPGALRLLRGGRPHYEWAIFYLQRYRKSHRRRPWTLRIAEECSRTCSRYEGMCATDGVYLSSDQWKLPERKMGYRNRSSGTDANTIVDALLRCSNLPRRYPSATVQRPLRHFNAAGKHKAMDRIGHTRSSRCMVWLSLVTWLLE